MVDFPSSAAISAENERSLKSLIRAMSLVRGRFSLILIRCNYSSLRSQMMQRLHQQEQIQVRSIELSNTAQTLFTAIKAELGDETPQALVVSGLETVERLDTLLLATNQVRDEFSKSLKCPLVLWVTSEVLTQLVRLAPDFYSWAASPISFQPSATELEQFLRQQADRCFAEILEPHQPLPIDDLFRCQSQALPRRQELEAALHDLHNENEQQSDSLASRQFILGEADYREDKINPAIAHYTASLTFWQQTNHLERQGATLLRLGLCSLRSTEIDSARKVSHLEAARNYLQICLDTFESANRPDLKAKFIGYAAETLKRLNDWAALQTLVRESETLHRTYPITVEQARDQGLLAEVALHHLQDNLSAHRHAEAALRILDTVADPSAAQTARFWVLLAQAQQNLNQPDDAVRSLHQARNQIAPKDNPHLYIQILEQLRTLYFGQKQYREAFQFKHEQLRIESHLGFRAFIGAGSLQPHPPRRRGSRSETIAGEIAVSGRQRDVNRLVERVSRDDCKLTLLHGQLGVGKSSLIQAGLIPALEQESIKARDAVVVLLRSYNHWTDKLAGKLEEQIQTRKHISIAFPRTREAILEQLRHNENLNLLTVLIFDQFEEFFFSCSQVQARQKFFAFLSACLEIPFIKIILSLREDYLHYLLEWERFDDLEPINDNILSKEHRYSLGNFSAEDTRRIIQGLTNRSHLLLENELVNQLVQDLTGEMGEVRPIELQVVGAQLHEEKIKALEQYRRLGDRPKETLVQNYLEGVVRDCGAENENAARLVLFLLTGENNTRPSKTRDELETDLKALEKDLLKEAEKLDLVLEIFRQSGLVFLLPEIPADRYQLVHDYLVEFIRKQQPKIDELVKELEVKRRQLEEAENNLEILKLEKKLAEEQEELARERRTVAENKLKLEKAQKLRLLLGSALLLFFGIAAVSTVSLIAIQNLKNQIAGTLELQYRSTIGSYNDHAEDLIRYNDRQSALVKMIEAGTLLASRYLPDQQNFRINSPDRISKRTVQNLQKAIGQAVSIRDVTSQEQADISKNVENLKPEELYALLLRLLNTSCTHVNRQVLETRKWEAPLCPDSQ